MSERCTRHLHAVPDLEAEAERPEPEPSYPQDRKIIRMTDRLHDIGHVELAHQVLNATELWDKVLMIAFQKLSEDAETARIMANERAWK